MSNIATVTFTPWNSPAGFTALAMIQVKFPNVHICLWTFFAYPSNPHLFLATSTHVFPSTICFNLHTALLPKWWRTFFTHKPMFLSWPWAFLPQPFLQTSYSLTLDITSLIHNIFQNHPHHPEMVDCFILSLQIVLFSISRNGHVILMTSEAEGHLWYRCVWRKRQSIRVS